MAGGSDNILAAQPKHLDKATFWFLFVFTSIIIKLIMDLVELQSMMTSILALPIFATILAAISSGFWVYLDAKNRNAIYAKTIAICIIVFLPCLLIYVVYRDRIGPQTQEPKPSQQLFGMVGFGSIFTILSARILTPTDPFSISSSILYLFPVGVAIGYLWIKRAMPLIQNS